MRLGNNIHLWAKSSLNSKMNLKHVSLFFFKTAAEESKLLALLDTVDTVGVNRLQMLTVQTACGHTKQTAAIEQRARWMQRQKARNLWQSNVYVLKAAAKYQFGSTAGNGQFIF